MGRLKRCFRSLGRHLRRRRGNAGDLVASVSRRLGAPLTSLQVDRRLITRGQIAKRRRERFLRRRSRRLAGLRRLLGRLMGLSELRARVVRVRSLRRDLGGALARTIDRVCVGTEKGSVSVRIRVSSSVIIGRSSG